MALGVAVMLVLGLTIFLTNRSDSDENAAAEQDAERSAQVQSFLDAWAAAQMSDDPSGLAKFVDSSAAPGVLERKFDEPLQRERSNSPTGDTRFPAAA